MRLAVVAALAVCGGMSAARAESFVQVAADIDGGAWVLVDRTEHLQPPPLVAPARRIELRRITRDGRATTEPTGRDEPVEAIAVGRDDGALWALTGDAVLLRDRAGTWAALDVPPPTAPTGESLQAFYAIVPLGGDRALVARGCALDRITPHVLVPQHEITGISHDAESPAPASACAELFIVELGAHRIEPALTIAAHIKAIASDRHGGAWLALSRDTYGGLAHLDGGAWMAWMHDGDPIDGMTDGGRLVVIPPALAARGIEVNGAKTDIPDNVDDLGHAFAESALSGGSRVIASRGDDVMYISDEHTFGDELDDAECTPSVYVVAHRTPTDAAMSVPTPGWWRRAHRGACPAVLQADAAGGNLWLLSSDAIFTHDGHRWRTIEAAGDHPGVLSDITPLLSIPVAFGYSDRDPLDNALTLGLRTEILLARDVRHPAFGIGPFVELATIGGDTRETFVGGGATVAVYARHLAFAGSLGFDAVRAGGDWHGQPVVSGFLGHRGRIDRDLPLDAPFGVRVDVRPATDALPTTVSASLSLDAATIAVWAAALSGAVGGG
jgi:hypothetical protein